MKRVLSILLCVIILGAVTIPAFAATKITTLEAEFPIPAVGSTYHQNSKLTVAEPSKYTAVLESMWYFDNDGNVIYLKDKARIPNQSFIRAIIHFYAKDGYEIPDYRDGGVEYIISGYKLSKDVTLSYAENNTVAYWFNPIGISNNGNDTTESVAQRITNFFRDLLDRLTAFFNSLFPKV